MLEDVCRGGFDAAFERLRAILQEGETDKKTQYSIEALWDIRRNGFKDFPGVRLHSAAAAAAAVALAAGFATAGVAAPGVAAAGVTAAVAAAAVGSVVGVAVLNVCIIYIYIYIHIVYVTIMNILWSKEYNSNLYYI